MSGDVQDPNDPSQPGQGNPAAGGSQSPQQQQERMEALARKWELIARQAAQIAKAQGYLPLGSEYLIEPIRPHLDPYAMLRHFVSMCRKDDYSWSRGSRRAAWRGLYLPSLNSEGIGELVVAIDTSGSTADVVPLFLGFLNSVLIEVKPDRVHFIECDAAVHNVTEFQAGEELPSAVAVRGFGGTDMRPIWEWTQENDVHPVCAIVLTDGEMSENSFGPSNGPGFPVLWVVSNSGRVAPFGETVEMHND
jgi:predicted metal-dependent peptidase